MKKILLSFFIGTAACVLLSVIFFKIFLPKEKIKSLAVERLSKEIGASVSIKDASIGLSGVSVFGLSLIKPGQRIEAESIVLRPAWKELLLEKRLRILELSVLSPRIQITAAPPEAPPSAPPGTERESKKAPFKLEKLSAADGTIELQSGLVLRGLNLEASGVSMEAPFELSLKTKFEATGKKGSLEFLGSLDPQNADLSRAGISAKKLSVLFDGKTYSASGSLKPLNAPAGRLSVSLPAFKFPQIEIPALSGTLDAASRNGLLSLNGIDLKGEGASLRGAILQTEKGWRLSGISAALAGVALQASGSWESPSVDAAVSAIDLDLEKAQRWVSALKEYSASGLADVQLRVSGPQNAPEFAGAALLKKVSLAAGGRTLKGLEGRVAFDPEQFRGRLGGLLGGTGFSADFSVLGLAKTRRTVSVNGSLDSLDLSLLTPNKKTENTEEKTEQPPPGTQVSWDLTGTLKIAKIIHPRFSASDSEIKVDLKGLGAPFSALNGVALLRVGPGKFEELKTLGASNPFLKTLLMPLLILQKASSLLRIPLLPSFDRAEFKEILGDYEIKDGLLTVKKSHLDSTPAFVAMKGTADLPKDALDLRVNIRLSKNLAVAGPIGFSVKGSLKEPSVKLDTAAILKQPQVEKALKQGEELLKGLFKR